MSLTYIVLAWVLATLSSANASPGLDFGDKHAHSLATRAGGRYGAQGEHFNPYSAAWTPTERCPRPDMTAIGTFCLSAMSSAALQQSQGLDAGYVRLCVLTSHYNQAVVNQARRIRGLDPAAYSAMQMPDLTTTRSMPPDFGLIWQVAGSCPQDHLCVGWGPWFDRNLPQPLDMWHLAEMPPGKVQCVPHGLDFVGDKRLRPEDDEHERHGDDAMRDVRDEGDRASDQNKRLRYSYHHSPHDSHIGHGR